MSNFTTFFPSAGGGGGEGSGINSYAPFKVGNTDNNPQGYNYSTGLYTNPIDSSVWLKTGNTVVDNASPATYPNALRTALGYGTISTLFSAGTQTQSGIGGITILNGKYWVAANGFSAGFIYEYTFAGVYTGNSIDTRNEHSRLMTGLTTDGTDLWMMTDYSGGFKYTTAGVYTNDSTGSISNARGITYSSGTNSLWIGVANSTKKINEYTLAGAATGVGIILPNSGANPPKCIFSSGANTIQWLDDQNGKIYETNLTTLVSSQPYGNIAILSSAEGLTYNTTEGYHVYSQANNLKSWGDLGASVGDSVARTDSSGSAQPLFIKLK